MDRNIKYSRLTPKCYISLVLLLLFFNCHIASSDDGNSNLKKNGITPNTTDDSVHSPTLKAGNRSATINDSHSDPNVTTTASRSSQAAVPFGADKAQSTAATTENVATPSMDKNSPNTTLDTATVTPSPDTANATNVSTTTVTPIEPVLPDKGSAEEEHNSSMSIFFVLCVLALGILLIHLMLQTNFRYLPESVVIVFLGGAIGMIINLMSHQNIANWRKEEAFSPTAFFLVLLPPIIFESGYNLHKGNFFQNIGSILVFAIFGTAISAFVIGAGIYLLGLAGVAYKLSFVESFAFGSLISAVDPVATVAIFHALDVDPVLNMLVFGESILNDAISIVLTTSVLESNNAATTSEAIILGINQFCLMFFASAGIGVVFALISALLLKHIDLRKNPSLEFGLMLVFTYAPYVLAEGIHLSGEIRKVLPTIRSKLKRMYNSAGIMAILFNGIVMSHYTHFNLSTVTQITMQQTMRTLAFIAETCVFAYLGLALFSFRHRVGFWILCLTSFSRLGDPMIISFRFSGRTGVSGLVFNSLLDWKGSEHLSLSAFGKSLQRASNNEENDVHHVVQRSSRSNLLRIIIAFGL